MSYTQLIILVYFKNQGADYSLGELQKQIGASNAQLMDELDALFEQGALGHSNNLIVLTDKGRLLLVSHNMLGSYFKENKASIVDSEKANEPFFPLRFVQQAIKQREKKML